MYEDEGYVFAAIAGLVVFLGSWVYCIAEYGYLLGVGLGWLPSMIVGLIAFFLYPLVWIGAAIIGYMIYKG